MPNLGFTQNQTIKQTQTIAPQQQQALKLLQMNSIELDQRIKEELLENPLLELKDDKDDQESIEIEENKPDESDEIDIQKDNIDEHLEEYNLEDIDPEFTDERMSKEQEESSNLELYAKNEGSLQEYLISQINDYFIDKQEANIAKFIIGCINDKGFLDVPIEVIADELNIENTRENIDWLKGIIEKIKAMEPYGCGSQTIQEALLAQLKILDKENSIHYEIIEKYYKDFTKKKIRDLSRKLDRPPEIIESVLNEIGRLSIYPGDKFSNSQNLSAKVVADVTVYLEGSEVKFEVNSSRFQSLQLKQEYLDLLKNKKIKNEKDKTLLREKRESAKFLINAIAQRRTTIEKVMVVLIEKQKEYFLTGDVRKLKPLNLQEVADVVGVHQATISRVINSKYANTPYGTFVLKKFFPSSIKENSGEQSKNRSNVEVMDYIKEIIENEDKKKPFSDDKIVLMLETKKGVKIARRTVQKYRDAMNIPSARYRKKF